jgi:serine/threonine protein kinase
LREAAAALAHCHANSIVHGDVKLENMLLHQNAVKLCDFGLAAMIDEVRVGRPYGTSAYMAPELVQITSKTAVYTMTPAQDVWGMGIVLYAVLFADLPWEKAVPKDPDYSCVQEAGGIEAGPMCFGSLAPGMRKLMSGLLHPDPEQRISMAELVTFLSESWPWFIADEPDRPRDTSLAAASPATPSVDWRSDGNHGILESTAPATGAGAASAAGGIEIPTQSRSHLQAPNEQVMARSWNDEHYLNESPNRPQGRLERSAAHGNRRSSSISGLAEYALQQSKLAGVDMAASTTGADLQSQLSQLRVLEQQAAAPGRRDSAHF